MKNIMNFILAIVIITLGVFDAYASGNGGSAATPPPPPLSPSDVVKSAMNDANVYRLSWLTPDGEYLAQVNTTPPGTVLVLQQLVVSKPGIYGVNRFAVDARPDINTLPWGILQKGDIMFMRDIHDSLGSTMATISGLTHAGMVYDTFSEFTVESWGQRGVDKYDTKNIFENSNVWKKAQAVRIRRAYGSAPYTAQQVEMAFLTYRYTPFFPPVPLPTTLSDRIAVIRYGASWIDKNNMSSMYCSKFVWNTYKNFLWIDLDSNQVLPTVNTNWAFISQTGASFLGVTPDDLYFSPILYNIGWSNGSISI